MSEERSQKEGADSESNEEQMASDLQEDEEPCTICFDSMCSFAEEREKRGDNDLSPL
jgi:hypothetical protein